MSNNFEHCHVHTTNILSSKVKFTHTSTDTRSHSCYGKKYPYGSRTSCYIFVMIIVNYVLCSAWDCIILYVFNDFIVCVFLTKMEHSPTVKSEHVYNVL